MKNWGLKFIISILTAMLMTSCAFMSKDKARTLTLEFKADSTINSNVLLPVDIIVIPAPVMQKIIKIGPEDWFGSQLRDTLLDDELYLLAMSGGGQRSKNIVLKPDIYKVLVYADFEDAVNRDAQQLIIDCPDTDNQYTVLIRGNNLELKQSEQKQ